MGSFAMWSTCTLLAVTVSVWWMPDVKEVAHTTASPAQPVWPLLRQPAVAWLFASIFFHVLAHIAVYVFFSLYLDSLGYRKTTIGLLWAVSVVLEIGWFFMQGRWIPLLSLSAWLVLASALVTVRMALTAGWPTVWPLLVVAQMLHAITFATHHTACVALISHHFAGRLRGRGQALYTVIGYGVPGVLGGLGGGAISSWLGLSAVFWGATLAGLVATACAMQARKRMRRHG